MNQIKLLFSGLMVLMVVVACKQTSTPEPTQWFSEAEAEALRLSEEDIVALSAQAKGFSQGGPEIKIVFPEITGNAGSSRRSRIEFWSPTNFGIEFKQTQAPIDYETLEVRGKKFGITKSVTDLVLPYLNGNLLMAENIDLPKGKFLIEVEIKDIEGRETTRGYFVESK